MTESESVVQSTAQVQAASTGQYNFNLTVSGQLQLAGQETENIQETEDETTQTNQAPGESDSVVQSTSQVQAAPTGQYNFNFTVSGQLQLAGQETEDIEETADEATQTSGNATPTPTPTPY
jgi:gamma-glutamylcysteine synthetase